MRLDACTAIIRKCSNHPGSAPLLHRVLGEALRDFHGVCDPPDADHVEDCFVLVDSVPRGLRGGLRKVAERVR